MSGFFDYEVRVHGQLTERLVRSLELHDAEIDTVIMGASVDQAALRGLLDRIHHLGLEVVALHRRPAADTADRNAPP